MFKQVIIPSFEEGIKPLEHISKSSVPFG